LGKRACPSRSPPRCRTGLRAARAPAPSGAQRAPMVPSDSRRSEEVGQVMVAGTRVRFRTHRQCAHKCLIRLTTGVAGCTEGRTRAAACCMHVSRAR